MLLGLQLSLFYAIRDTIRPIDAIRATIRPI